MNKIAMGKYLNQLRKSKKMSQQDVADYLSEHYFETTNVTVGKWERGETIPEIDKLMCLSELYECSIDDLLSGGKRDIDFSSLYPNDELDFTKRLSNKDMFDHFQRKRKEAIVIRKKFESLIKKSYSEELSVQEMDEVRYLFKTFYNKNDGCDFRYLYELIVGMNYESAEEKWWEVRKMLIPNDDVSFRFGLICDRGFEVSDIAEYFMSLDDFEKDILLSEFQSSEACNLHKVAWSSKAYESYEKDYGFEYDREKINKDTIRWIINHGAKLNKSFLDYKIKTKTKIEITDVVDRIYEGCHKPIEFAYFENINEPEQLIYAENNDWNLLFIDYKYDLVNFLRDLGYEDQEIFDMVMKYSEIPYFIYEKYCHANNIDTDRKKELVMADCKNAFFQVDTEWKEFHDLSEQRSNKYDKYLEKLKNGERYITGVSISDITVNSYDVIQSMTHKEYMRTRDNKLTKNLLSDLELISFDEIRKKYFTAEDLINE